MKKQEKHKILGSIQDKIRELEESLEECWNDMNELYDEDDSGNLMIRFRHAITDVKDCIHDLNEEHDKLDLEDKERIKHGVQKLMTYLDSFKNLHY